MILVGLTGTNGAGKGVAAEYLARHHGFSHYSVRACLTREIERRGLHPDRPTLREVGNELRETFGPAYLVDLPLTEAERKGDKRVLIESIRAVAELECIHAKGGVILAIDADPHERYRRIRARDSATDNVTFEEFCAHEKAEAADERLHGMQQAAVIARADVVIRNDHTLHALHTALDTFVQTLAPPS